MSTPETTIGNSLGCIGIGTVLVGGIGAAGFLYATAQDHAPLGMRLLFAALIFCHAGAAGAIIGGAFAIRRILAE